MSDIRCWMLVKGQSTDIYSGLQLNVAYVGATLVVARSLNAVQSNGQGQAAAPTIYLVGHAQSQTAISVAEYADRKGFLVTNPSSKAKPKATAKAREKMSTATTTTDPRTKNELIEENEELHGRIHKIWNVNADITDTSSKKDALAASLETCEILNEFDAERFPFDSDEDEDDEEEAA